RRERPSTRHRWDDGEVLADRGRARPDHLGLLDRAKPPLRGLSDHGSSRRPRGDRQRRRQHRLGGRLRPPPRRPALRRRPAGGGGMHAVALASELGIRKVVIPRAADVFSAWGMLMSDLRRDYFVTRLLGLNPDNASRLDTLLDEITGAALEQFSREGIQAERVRFIRYGNLRYENQEHGVEVVLPDGEIDPAIVAETTE